MLPQCTMYVSLEPCAHWGKTPLCANLIVSKGMKHVVCGCIAPFAKVKGRGVQILRNAGIEVTVGVLEKECLELNKAFITVNTLKRPYIILKWAQTANGCMGLLQQGRPQPISISTPTTRRFVHKLRADVDTILVGAGTWKADHPQLNVRAWYGPDPRRILISAHATQAPEGFWLAHSTNEVVSHLNEEGKQSLLVEGGAHTLQSFIAAELWDVTRMRMTSSGGAVASPAQPPRFHSSIF